MSRQKSTNNSTEVYRSKNLAVFILTLNEEVHIERAIRSAFNLSSDVYVIDSGSTDQTILRAQHCGATVLTNTWLGYADQVNYAINKLKKYDLLVRLDADEFFEEKFFEEFSQLRNKPFSSLLIRRRFKYGGRVLRFGGVGQKLVNRVFDPNRSICEDRPNDEHIITDGSKIVCKSGIIDENLNGFSFFLKKHIHYAKLEASSFKADTVNASNARFVKSHVYDRLPLFYRTFFYFIFRYIFLLGFLDGKAGLRFCFWQALVYRLMVDEIINENL